jgi:hypothetical protein
MRAALLDKQPVRSGAVNSGQVLPVHANNMRVDATAEEVVLSFELVLGGGSPAQPQVSQEVARLALSYHFVEQMITTVVQLLGQAHPIRVASLQAQLQELVERETPAAEAGGEPEPPVA